MKRYRVKMVLLFVVLMVLMVACGANQARVQPEEQSANTPMTQDEIAAPLPSPTPEATPAPALNAAPMPGKSGAPPAPHPVGKAILVDLSRQWLFAYVDGVPVFDNAVETGRPELPTPTGSFAVMEKVRNIMFTSPWPEGSPHYYEPTHVNYALLFKDGGFFLHDAWWHEQFGPGSNVPHQLPDGRWETGSHGCVGMPVADAERLHNWATVGTKVVISD